MHIHNDSTSRRTIWRAQINWSRELTFSGRQKSYVRDCVPHIRGVYCIYSKYHTFDYSSTEWATKRWSSVIYVGSGWIDDRLCAHLTYQKNGLLAGYLDSTQLAYRYDRIVHSDIQDWPRTVEAGLLGLFEWKFGQLPRANKRRETFPELEIDKFVVQQTSNFNYLARG